MFAIGIDIGTTTISIVVVNKETGELAASRTVNNDSFLAQCNTWERMQEPEKIIAKSIELLNPLIEEYKDIAVIGLTGQMHGIVYIDDRGRCISPLYTWQDGSGNVECFDGKSVCQILADKYQVPANAGYGLITYLYHCKTNCVPMGACKVCTIMDYLGMVLTGRRQPLMHSSNAAGLGLFDSEKKRFMAELLKQEGGRAEIVPETTDSFVLLGTYRDIPVSAALGDNQASFLGSVGDAKEAVLVNMGTGGQVSALSDVYFSQDGIEARPFADGKYLLVGSSLCGGRAYALLKDFFASYVNMIGIRNVDHYAVMNQLLDSYDKENRVAVDTTFSGTRVNPGKRGSIQNINIDNFTPAAFTYGVLEGMAEELYQMYMSIQEGVHVSRSKMIASGNGIRKNIHLQNILRDRFEMEVQLAKYEEEAAYGAARSGMIAAGLVNPAQHV